MIQASQSQTVMETEDKECTFIAGFNGFHQIDHICRPSAASKDAVTDASPVLYSLPQKVLFPTGKASNMVISWTRVVVITENGSLVLSGHHIDSNNKKYAKDNRTFKSGVSINNHIILLTKEGQMSAIKEGESNLGELKVEGELSYLNLTGTTDNCLIAQDKSGKFVECAVDTISGVCHPLEKSMDFGIPVTSVSCGKEHVLLLTSQGSVYSYGSGSHGQLGQGEVTVDEVKNPKLIEDLEGIPVNCMEAGGWHSVALTETGDVYVWGWNESGQLGIPNKEETEERFCLAHTVTTDSNSQEIQEDWKIDLINKENEQEKPDEPEVKVTASNDCCDNFHKCESKHCKEFDSTCSCKVKSDRTKSERILCIIQDLEPIQIQSSPQVLDIPEGMRVTKVSCGSRHTAMVTADGLLLVSGWNGYGQLCLGDTDCRDYLETSTYFMDRKLEVTDVVCKHWNTVVTVRDNT